MALEWRIGMNYKDAHQRYLSGPQRRPMVVNENGTATHLTVSFPHASAHRFPFS